MLKFFRRIRQDLISNGKTGKYFKYAIGEIILVVIGILIALWINNLNQKHQQNKESVTLISNLKQELNENLDQFSYRYKLLIETNKDLIGVLNFSASDSTSIPLDSLRLYITKALTLETAILNNSRLSSAKASGKFSLLSEDITTLLSDYETSCINYLKYIDMTALAFNKDWSEAIIRFNSLANMHSIYYEDTALETHPKFKMDDSALSEYLKKPETYYLLHQYYTKYMVEKAWLGELQYRIKSVIKTMDNQQ